MARYRNEGDTAFEPRSRRPLSNPNRVSDVVNNQILNLRDQLSSQGLDAGPETTRWHHRSEIAIRRARVPADCCASHTL
jgi:hypothetical protein